MSLYLHNAGLLRPLNKTLDRILSMLPPDHDVNGHELLSIGYFALGLVARGYSFDESNPFNQVCRVVYWNFLYLF